MALWLGIRQKSHRELLLIIFLRTFRGPFMNCGDSSTDLQRTSVPNQNVRWKILPLYYYESYILSITCHVR